MDRRVREFLRERGMLTAYNRYKRIKGARKRRLEMMFPNYDGTVEKRQILVLKERGRTVVRDQRTLRVLARSKKSITRVMAEITQRVMIKKRLDSSLSGDVTLEVTRNRRSLAHEHVTRTYNRRLLSGWLRLLCLDASILCSHFTGRA